MTYTEEQLNKLHDIELDILQEVIRVCEENDITYFTVAGTALGAVRHNGFIPWDDDVDIGMLRSDYDRFVSIAPEKLRKGYTICHFFYEPTTPTYYAKVKKDGTLFVEKYTKNIKMHQGVFIDIMPFDKVPEQIKTKDTYYRRAQLWNHLYIAKTVWVTTFNRKRYKVLLDMIRALLHIALLPVPKKILFEKTDQSLRMYEESESDLVSSRGKRKTECPVDRLVPTRLHKFENIEVHIPADYDYVLKHQYGDYMKLPPEDKRHSHAPIILEI